MQNARIRVDTKFRNKNYLRIARNFFYKFREISATFEKFRETKRKISQNLEK
jgi:hypothetical protein